MHEGWVFYLSACQLHRIKSPILPFLPTSPSPPPRPPAPPPLHSPSPLLPTKRNGLAVFFSLVGQFWLDWRRGQSRQKVTRFSFIFVEWLLSQTLARGSFPQFRRGKSLTWHWVRGGISNVAPSGRWCMPCTDPKLPLQLKPEFLGPLEEYNAWLYSSLFWAHQHQYLFAGLTINYFALRELFVFCLSVSSGREWGGRLGKGGGGLRGGGRGEGGGCFV